MTRLTVIIPTVGRGTLKHAQMSAAGAEIVTVPDSSGDNGYTARTTGILQATGTHLAFLDDDDAYTPGAVELMTAAACDRPVIFRMDHPSHGVLWRTPKLEFGNVGTPMFVVPNDPVRLGQWAPHAPHLKEPGGDFTFIRGCAEKMGDPVWRDEITTVIRPHERRTVAVVTPWMNHLELADAYFAALTAGPEPTETIVVDNASDPPLAFAAVRSETNLGFSGGSNRGLHQASADIVVFLNNDVQAVRQGWLWELTRHAEPGVLVGAQLRHDPHADVDGERLPYLDGWCLAGMREDLLGLGGFDETYEEPAYYSDNDLCLRARAAGMSLREIQVGIRHLGGATSQANGYLLPSTIANRARYQQLARELLAA